jgi:hypothetical protein
VSYRLRQSERCFVDEKSDEAALLIHAVTASSL